jgi:ubiquinone/menaquinone biosynthesis C-methylase UbiE
LLSTAKKLTRESSLIQGDAEALPLRKSIFVGIYSFTLIQNTPNPVTAMAEMARVVRVGGWVVVTAIRKAFTRESFECLIESQEWAELHLSEEDSHDIVAYAMIRN